MPFLKFLPINLFRRANYFLLSIAVIVLLNCFLTFNNITKNSSPNQTKDFEVRILEKQNYNFGQSKYTLWSEKGFITAKTSENYLVGNTYKIRGEYQSIASKEDLTSYDWYFLSFGQQGELKKPLKVLANLCDSTCHVIQSLNSFKNNFRLQLQYSACHTNYFVLKWLNLDAEGCRNSSNFSYSLVLGGTNGFDEKFKSEIKKVGLTHLVAFSGFQVALIVAFLEKLLSSARISRNWRVLISFLTLALTILLVGLQPPVLRSALSIALSTTILLLFGVRLATLRALIYSALVLLIINPLYIINLSFQLSFLATFGLILAPKIEIASSFLQFKLWKILVTTLCETLGAFLFTLPIILKINSGVSLIGILANLVIVPFVPILTLLNIILIVPGASWIVGLFVNLIQGIGLILVRDLASLEVPWLLIKWQMNSYDTVIYYVLLIVACLIINSNTQKRN